MACPDSVSATFTCRECEHSEERTVARAELLEQQCNQLIPGDDEGYPCGHFMFTAPPATTASMDVIAREVCSRIVTDVNEEQQRLMREVDDHLAGCFALCPGCDRCRDRRDGDAVSIRLRWFR
jgi:hypothetical protein